MHNYNIKLKKIDIQQELELTHHDKFSELMIQRMTNRAMNEAKWDGTHHSYRAVRDYMISFFGFKQQEGNEE